MFYKLINTIKFNITIKKKRFSVENNKNNIKLLNLFIKLNIIKFIKIDNRFVEVTINQKIYFKGIKNMYKPSKPLHMDLKNIKKMTYKRGWIFILSTDQGLMTNLESIKKNLGGVLIACLII